MLERIREGSQGPWAMVIIGLIVLSFVFAGVSSYMTSSGSTAAAVVNGEEISQQELDRAYQSQRARLESQFGEGISALFADESYLRDFRSGILDNLIGEKLILQKANEIGLRVSDEQIRKAILQMPEFQTAGQFDNERYLALLRQNGFQASGFRDYLRQQMTKEQLSRALSASDFTLDNEAQFANLLQGQTRDAEFLVIDSAQFAADVEVTAEEVNAYYESNLAQFDTQEKVSIAYVELDLASLKDDVTVSDEEVQQFYDENKALYKSEEERRVSHILIETGDDEAAAKEQAEALLAQLKDGADFAELATNESQDVFSAENGGDLDFITQGMMEPAFDEAAFALQNVGDFSDVVETEFGFHIIKLTDIKPEAITPFEEIKDSLHDELVTDAATDRYFALQSTMAEIAFEVPDTLQDVAGAIDAEVKETPLFSRNNAPEPVNTPLAIETAFSPELVDEGLNSDLVELSDSKVLVMRVAQHEPQRTRSIDEVRTDILARLRAQKAQEAAQQWAQEQVDAIEAGESVDAALAEKSVSWDSKSAVTRNSSELPRNLVSTLFSLSQASDMEVAKLSSGDVGVVRMTAINKPEAMDAEALAAMKQQLTSQNSQTVYQSFVNALRNDADVEVLVTR